MAKFTREPAVIVNAITAIVSAAICVGAVFGLDLDAAQAAKLATGTAALAPLVASLILRQFVTPVATAKAQAEQARAAGALEAVLPRHAADEDYVEPAAEPDSSVPDEGAGDDADPVSESDFSESVDEEGDADQESAT